MERDALIAHGTSFLLQDRLMNCSDYSTAWVCRTCGSLISLGYDEKAGGGDSFGVDGSGAEYCRICDTDSEVKKEKEKVLVPGRKISKKGVMDVIAVPCELFDCLW